MSKHKPHLSFFLPPLIGAGGERVVLNLAKTLVEWDIKIDLVVPDVSGRHAAFSHTIPTKVNLVNLETPKTKTVYFKKLLKLKTYLEQTNPDVLLANVDYVGVANAARAISKCSTKVVQVVHSNLSREFDTISGPGRLAKRWFARQFYPWSDGVIAVSKGVAADVAAMTGIAASDVKVIYNPVVTAELPAKAQEPVDHPWLALGEPPVILGAGRLMYQKDFPTLVRAFAKVRQQRPCRLIIVGGENNVRPELESLIGELDIRDDAALPGFAPNPYAYMAKASVFVLSSLYEGFGNVLVEAMATGTPVVSTDCPDGPAEILENGRYGPLVPVSSPDVLADAIIKTLDNPIDSNVLRQRAQEFTSEKIAKAYLDYVQSL